MRSNLIEIYFYFPQTEPKNKQELVDLIMESMRKDGTIQYAGYANEKSLQNDLLRHIGNYKADVYGSLPTKKKLAIEKIIYETIRKCNEILPLPAKNFVFVFPWCPSEGMELFQGSLGYAPYRGCILHIFIAPDIFTGKSLANSIAHEINHAIWSYYNSKKSSNWSLLDYIVNEGLAENFREAVLKNTKPAPWAIALTKEEAFSVLISIKSLLNSKSQDVRQEILFGSKKYKRWTGYSIGYWLLKEFRVRYPQLQWQDLTRTKPKDILEAQIEKRT